MILTDKLKTNIKGSKFKTRLAFELDVDRDTIYKWLKRDSKELRNLKFINAVTKLTGLTQEEMFVEEETQKFN